MAYTTLALGLTLTLPTDGTRNWGSTMRNTTWTKISQHAHTGSGDGNQIGTNGFADFSVSRNKLKKALGLYPAPTVTPLGTAQALDFDLGSIATVDLGSATGNVDLTLSNPIAGVTYKVISIQAATPRDLNWPVSVKWPQGQKPILSQADNAIDIINLYYDGSNYFGEWNNDFQ